MIDQDKLKKQIAQIKKGIKTNKEQAELHYKVADELLIKQRNLEETLRRSKLRATDHCIIRYMERVLGYDIEAIKEQMVLTIKDKVQAFGDGKYDTEFGTVVVKDSTIVTLIHDNEQE